jgi:cell wall-associated NlpC family hydrolase
MRFSLNWHGPVASMYAAMGSHVPAGQEQPGDLVVWATHIGIVVGGGHMVSALSSQYGTKVTPYDWGPKGEPHTFRRIVSDPTGGAGNRPVRGPHG